MKRCITIVLVILILFSFVWTSNVMAYTPQSYAEKHYEGNTNHAVMDLKNMGIINDTNIWYESDRISRRDMYKALYVIYTGKRNLLIQPSDMENATIMEEVIFQGRININDNKLLEWDGTFQDIENGSFDACFAYSLVGTGLMKGRCVEGSHVRIVDFNSGVTYEEALIAICRLLINPNQGLISSEIVYGNYFDLACKMNLINSSSPIDYLSPQITEDMLNKYIPAKELAYLIKRALYVTTFNSGFASTEFRYIDYMPIEEELYDENEFVVR